MQRTSIGTALVATLAIALTSIASLADAKLLLPVDGAAYAEPAPVVEFHHAAKNLYFVTTDPVEIAAIDALLVPGWSRVSNEAKFLAFTEPVTARDERGTTVPALPVCRFFVPPASHFFSASPAECAAVRNAHPKLVLETEAAFYAWLPDASGHCGKVVTDAGIVELQPVYRLWNAQGASNHRYTTDRVERASMIETGWVAEGYGDAGVAMCVPR